jgi:phospholipid-transporting ATPase
VDVTSKYLSAWGEDGLRTLCFAYRSIPEEEFESWFEVYNAALRNDAEKAKFDRKVFPNAIDDAMNAIEQGFILQVGLAVTLVGGAEVGKVVRLPNSYELAHNPTSTRSILYSLGQGATANEDRLQEEVPETISTLAEAGVKVRWCGWGIVHFPWQGVCSRTIRCYPLVSQRNPLHPFPCLFYSNSPSTCRSGCSLATSQRRR